MKKSVILRQNKNRKTINNIPFIKKIFSDNSEKIFTFPLYVMRDFLTPEQIDDYKSDLESLMIKNFQIIQV